MGENEQAAVLIPGQEKAGLGMTALDDFTPLVRSHQQRVYRVLLGTSSWLPQVIIAGLDLFHESHARAVQGVDLRLGNPFVKAG